MNGRVDESLRALLDVRIGNTPSLQPVSLTVWIDTAFDGFFVFPRDTIDKLGLRQEATAEAILADGSRKTLESYICYVEWFGEVLAAQVIANVGKSPLLGTELLVNHRLVVDYVDRIVSIS